MTSPPRLGRYGRALTRQYLARHSRIWGRRSSSSGGWSSLRFGWSNDEVGLCSPGQSIRAAFQSTRAPVLCALHDRIIVPAFRRMRTADHLTRTRSLGRTTSLRWCLRRQRRHKVPRIGLRALVTMTRMNSSVDTSAIVSFGLLVTPALTNNMSSLPCSRRERRAAICSGIVISTVAISIPWRTPR
jgi:hypothetical protein